MTSGVGIDAALKHDRIPPHNLECEMAVLGSILVDRDLYEVVREIVRAEDFYAHVHETLYRTIGGLIERGEACDKIAVAHALREAGKLEVVGGLSYISSLMDTVQTASTAAYHAKIVADTSALRQLIAAGDALYRSAYDGQPEGAQEVAARAIALIESIAERSERHIIQDAPHAVWDTVRLIEDGGMKLRKTQWSGVNDRLGGFARREMTIWGANPGMGKTGAVMSLLHYAATQGVPGAFACLEMGNRATMMRYAAMLAGIATKKIREGKVDPNEFRLIIDKLYAHFNDYNILLLDKRPAWSVNELNIALRKRKREMGDLGIVVIDHVGFLKDVKEGGGGRHAMSRHERLNFAFENLLAMADDLDCELHVVQHMNRSAKDGVPTMFDLRDGGNPEGHAHNILIPWRPSPDDEDPDKRAEGYFCIDKARDGETGLIPMRFWGARSMWVDPDHAHPWWEQYVA